ncbi:MAG: hypothetical protein LBT46_07200 [Planctomycetaceae bacterium]|jgi:hypothetical protein|nr:hypothetical protein [Planctomycetaceae bacterium]
MPAVETALIQDAGTFASTLLLLAVDRFGVDVLSGENGPLTAETLIIGFKEHFGVDLPQDNLGKLMAAVGVIATNNLLRGLPSFLATVHGLLGDGTDWSYAEPIDTEDLAWAVTEALLLCPPEEEDVFDRQIVAYCRTILKKDGLMSPPAVLSFAKEADIYGDIGLFGEDILMEQSNRTNDVNEYIEEQVQKLLNQIASIPSLQVQASQLSESIKQELAAVSSHDKWT